jgi:hypothetical protein
VPYARQDGFSHASTSLLEEEVNPMNPTRILACLLLLAMVYVMVERASARAEQVVHTYLHRTQTSQESRQGKSSQAQQLVRPTPRELAGISDVLAATPRPKTLTDADTKYLKGLLGKPAWFSFEQRIVHELWTEVTGKEWAKN